jgi:hypothetical protein
MKTRTATARTGLGARLTVAGWATATIVASASVAACSGSAPRATLPKLSPGTASASSTVSATPSATPRASPSASRSVTPRARPSPTPSPSATSFPTVAPATGGGGTAGFQHAWLVDLGGVAILVGAGCIAYRRKVIRNR